MIWTNYALIMTTDTVVHLQLLQLLRLYGTLRDIDYWQFCYFPQWSDKKHESRA
jgi:hypothetical protein